MPAGVNPAIDVLQGELAAAERIFAQERDEETHERLRYEVQLGRRALAEIRLGNARANLARALEAER